MTRLRVFVVAVALGGCVPQLPPLERVYAPLSVGDDAPADDCERSRWLELAPTVVRWRERRELVPDRVQESLSHGVYTHDARTPMPAAEVFARVDAPEVARTHQRRLDDAHARERRGTVVLLVGAAAALVGAGLFVGGVYAQDAGDARTALLVSGGALGLAGVVSTFVGWGILPSREERVATLHGERLFVRGEDDLDALRAALRQQNLRARSTCAATPRGGQ